MEGFAVVVVLFLDFLSGFLAVLDGHSDLFEGGGIQTDVELDELVGVVAVEYAAVFGVVDQKLLALVFAAEVDLAEEDLPVFGLTHTDLHHIFVDLQVAPQQLVLELLHQLPLLLLQHALRHQARVAVGLQTVEVQLHLHFIIAESGYSEFLVAVVGILDGAEVDDCPAQQLLGFVVLGIRLPLLVGRTQIIILYARHVPFVDLFCFFVHYPLQLLLILLVEVFG